MARTGETLEALEQRKAELLANRATMDSKLATLTARLRAIAREKRMRQQAVVGKLADDAGLLAYDLDTLKTAFQRLAATLGETTQ